MHWDVPSLDDVGEGPRHLDVQRDRDLQRPAALARGADPRRHDGRLRDVRDKVVAGAERHGVPREGRKKFSQLRFCQSVLYRVTGGCQPGLG